MLAGQRLILGLVTPDPLCDLEEVTCPLWASIASVSKERVD